MENSPFDVENVERHGNPRSLRHLCRQSVTRSRCAHAMSLGCIAFRAYRSNCYRRLTARLGYRAPRVTLANLLRRYSTGASSTTLARICSSRSPTNGGNGPTRVSRSHESVKLGYACRGLGTYRSIPYRFHGAGQVVGALGNVRPDHMSITQGNSWNHREFEINGSREQADSHNNKMSESKRFADDTTACYTSIEHPS